MMIVKKMELKTYYGEPTVEAMVEMEIDEMALARILGSKAMRNKSKRSTAFSGKVKVTVRPTTKEAAR